MFRCLILCFLLPDLCRETPEGWGGDAREEEGDRTGHYRTGCFIHTYTKKQNNLKHRKNSILVHT